MKKILLLTIYYLLTEIVFASQKMKIENTKALLGYAILHDEVYNQNGLKINVKKYGAKGDGATDDYLAIKKAVDAINAAGGGELFFPKGTYYIDQYVIPANSYLKTHDGKEAKDEKGNSIPVNIDLSGKVYTVNEPSLMLKNCNGLKIYGVAGSIISMKGDFDRPATSKGRWLRSDHIALSALNLIECQNVVIQNLEINGNVQKTSRAEGIVEASAASLVQFLGCKNVTINNLYIHHSETDGIVMKNSKILLNENFLVTNVRSYNNARQGMTIANLLNGKFINCEFSKTGLTENANYPGHLPEAGIDIEPDDKESKVKNVIFDRCKFEDNIGGANRISNPNTTANITFRNCVMNDLKGNKNPYFIITDAVNVVYENCQMDVKNSRIFPAWPKQSNTSSIFKNCHFKGTEIFQSINNDPTMEVTIENCILEYTGTNIVPNFFPNIRQPNSMIFRNNTIILPKRYCKNGQYKESSLIIAKINEGNIYLEKMP